MFQLNHSSILLNLFSNLSDLKLFLTHPRNGTKSWEPFTRSRAEVQVRRVLEVQNSFPRTKPYSRERERERASLQAKLIEIDWCATNIHNTSIILYYIEAPWSTSDWKPLSVGCVAHLHCGSLQAVSTNSSQPEEGGDWIPLAIDHAH